ncbi:MAG: exodeoxyribonuclease VII small subunit [Clostridia bacterium]|nr:exodeoxyribonuclease VII small subunit [Clostridia bacterium]
MADKKEKSFEEAMARLEEIVRSLEGGTAALDDSLGLFEEGISLVKLCNAKLEGAEQKVKLLSKGEDGTLTEIDFTGGGR